MQREVNHQNEQDNDQTNALHVAVETQNYADVELLLTNNLNINMQDHFGSTVLHKAVTTECWPIVELLLKNKADVNVKDASGKTALHLAVSTSNNIPIAIIESILNSTNNINAKDTSCGRTPVHYAAFHENDCALKALINANADVNAKDDDEYTPLHLMIYGKYQFNLPTECLKTLINNNADVNAVDCELKSPLHAACGRKYADAVKYLIENGADSSMRGDAGRTVFHYTCMNDDSYIDEPVENNIEEQTKDILEVLVEGNISVNDTDEYGQTPLRYVIERTHLYYTIELLLNIGADINNLDTNNTEFNTYIDPGNQLEKKTIECFHQHVIKMKLMKLKVDENILKKVYCDYSDDHLRWIEHTEHVCNEEIDLMKSTNIGESIISYYNFLKTNPRNAVNCVHNQDIVNALQLEKLTTMFPMYGHFLKCHLREVQRRSHLCDPIQDLLKSSDFEKLPTICMNEILKYLDNSDLNMLLKAMKPVVLLR